MKALTAYHVFQTWFKSSMFIDAKHRVCTDLEKSWKTTSFLEKCNLSMNCPGFLKNLLDHHKKSLKMIETVFGCSAQQKPTELRNR